MKSNSEYKMESGSIFKVKDRELHLMSLQGKIGNAILEEKVGECLKRKRLLELIIIGMGQQQ